MCAANNLWRRLATCEKSVAKQSGLQRIQGTLSPPQTKGHLIIFTWLIWLIPSPPPPQKDVLQLSGLFCATIIHMPHSKSLLFASNFFPGWTLPPRFAPPAFSAEPWIRWSSSSCTGLYHLLSNCSHLPLH